MSILKRARRLALFCCFENASGQLVMVNCRSDLGWSANRWIWYMAIAECPANGCYSHTHTYTHCAHFSSVPTWFKMTFIIFSIVRWLNFAQYYCACVVFGVHINLLTGRTWANTGSSEIDRQTLHLRPQIDQLPRHSDFSWFFFFGCEKNKTTVSHITPPIPRWWGRKTFFYGYLTLLKLYILRIKWISRIVWCEFVVSCHDRFSASLYCPHSSE